MLRALASAATSLRVRESSRPVGGRRREVQNRKRRRAQPVETREAVEVADDGNDAVRAKLGDILDAARQPVEAHSGMEQAGRAQRDVAAADQ
jgi:hypothetical protein